ncbi:MAG TPA: cache domain-containing protein [Anaerolineales bacterium]|nr:cache domain-containing protein [Anaerolineales bacterium]
MGSTTLHQNAMRDLVGERDERVVQMAARAVEDQITAREVAVRGLALQIGDAQDNGVSREDELQRILDRSAYLDKFFDAGLVIIDMQRNVVAARGSLANTLQNEEKVFSEGIQAFQANTNLSSLVTSAAPFAGTARTASFVFAPTQDRAYLVGGVFSVDAFAGQALQGAFSPGQEASVLMVDPGGVVLYQQGESLLQVDVFNHPGVQEALRGETGRIYTPDKSAEHVVAYTAVEWMNWGVLIEEPWEQVASPVLETTHLAPLAMIPVLLLSMFALLFAYRQVIRPLQALAKQAGSLGWGDYSAIERSVGGSAEIRYLH